MNFAGLTFIAFGLMVLFTDDDPDWYCPVCLGTTWHQFPEDCPR